MANPVSGPSPHVGLGPGPEPPRRFAGWFPYLLAPLASVLVAGMTVFVLRWPDPPPIVVHPPPTPAPTALPAPSPTPAPIVVFVSGAVQVPGNYTLSPEARAGDALALAGGLTAEADPNAVNQAARLWDGVQIYVPTVGEPGHAQPPAGVSGSDLSTLAAVEGATGRQPGQINVNTASIAELETLPGIGPAKAAAIVANRPYASIDDLIRVPGIGVKTVDDLRDLVSAD